MNIDYKNKFYIAAPAGLNPCILGNNKYDLRPDPNSVLPDCTGFVVGYYNKEIAKEKTCKYLGPEYPKDYIKTAKRQGLPTGERIQAPAVAVWSGHVAIIAAISASGAVTVYESSYNYKKGPIVRTVKYDNLTACKNAHKDFLGCIYEPPEKEATPAGPVVHTVVKGDTVSALAKKYGVTVKNIVKWNSLLNADLIKIGQKLFVSDPGGLKYVVQKGDTLTSIARKFNTTVKKLAELNNIKNINYIKAGEELKVK